MSQLHIASLQDVPRFVTHYLFTPSMRYLTKLLLIASWVGWPLASGTVAQEEKPFSLAQVMAWEEANEHQRAFDALSKEIKEKPNEDFLYYMRARQAFCLGNIKQSVADFDHYYKEVPTHQSRQWERGIALYYVNRFEDGAKQFELYQTYYSNDVENSVWRYVCLAKAKDVKTARDSLMPIRNDSRIPMMKIFELFKGEATIEDVFQAAKADAGTPEATQQQKFYAELYVGLWYEAQGDTEKAIEHLRKADEFGFEHYMADVAKVHLKLHNEKKAP